jgi:hypothetical protein
VAAFRALVKALPLLRDGRFRPAMERLWADIQARDRIEFPVAAEWVRNATIKKYVQKGQPCDTILDAWNLFFEPKMAKHITEDSWAVADYSQMAGALSQMVAVRDVMLPGAADDEARRELVKSVRDKRNDLMHIKPINHTARRAVVRAVLDMLRACGAPAPIPEVDIAAIEQLAERDIDAGVTEAELAAAISSWATTLRIELQDMGGRIIEAQRKELLEVLGEGGSFPRALRHMLEGYQGEVAAQLQAQSKQLEKMHSAGQEQFQAVNVHLGEVKAEMGEANRKLDGVHEKLGESPRSTSSVVGRC